MTLQKLQKIIICIIHVKFYVTKTVNVHVDIVLHADESRRALPSGRREKAAQKGCYGGVVGEREQHQLGEVALRLLQHPAAHARRPAAAAVQLRPEQQRRDDHLDRAKRGVGRTDDIPAFPGDLRTRDGVIVGRSM